MGLFRRRQDPISERERALSSEIAALEDQIRELDDRVTLERGQPRVRSTAWPHAAHGQPRAAEPGFEDLGSPRSSGALERGDTPAHFNELGVRKYDPLASLRRWLEQLRGTPASNPKLISYLAAGAIHGLRPLRYEKRIARNRFLALLACFILIVWGVVYFYLRSR
ncbi:MAG: hypothetical protein FJ387_22645 [Verrucomicrobia bacterium]|nr:hypothetical protein [Verrucomicrobiota bacterium]